MTRPNRGSLGAWAGEQNEPSANGAAGEDACKGGPSDVGVPTRGKVLTGRPCPRTAACGADGTRRTQKHGPGADTAWRTQSTLARVSNRGQALRQSRGGVCERGTDACAQRGETELAAMAEGNASGRYRELEGGGSGAAET
ncbi:hypothetical protein ERJ75_001031800 [Trypanosoma vivax]|nr:hypothetical protein ERJ75_001031800 [Trypanosoma vivax]